MNEHTLPDGAHFDFLIVGAGISGIGAAYHLRQQFPDCHWSMLDALPDFGGTWWTHRYPGARSDSDLYTYGYSFKPWSGRSIATAGEIRRYLAEVIEEQHMAPHMHFGHRITAAQWSSQQRRWTLQVQRLETGEAVTLSTDFLWMCQGYYGHEQAYTPAWPGLADFQGTLVHPQHWPAQLDCTGQRVVVVGSGATAATLIPALAESAAHVTMLQRSPSFFSAQPWDHALKAPLQALDIPDAWLHEILRRAHLAQTAEVVRMAVDQPQQLRDYLVGQAQSLLPEGFDVQRHFNPAYRPWQQRIALVPDGDLFAAIRSGKASVVTDTIERFDATGVCLASGEHLPADTVVTATGFELSLFGDIAFAVDGVPVDFSQRLAWRGMMIEGLPNMAFVMGYFRWSWTLRVDLVCPLVCRIIAHMREQGASAVVPQLPLQDQDMPRLAWMDPENFSAGYVMRSQHKMYRQGDRHPWKLGVEYEQERALLASATPDDAALVYET